MKNFFFCLLLLISFLATGSVLAGDHNGRVLTGQEMEEIFKEIVFARTTLPRDKLRIIDFSARPEAVTLPAGPLGYRVINPANADRPGRKMLHVALLVGGRQYSTVRMSGELRIYDQVVCATANLPRHALLAGPDVEVVEMDISMMGSGLIKEPAAAIGKRLATAVRPGTVLQNRHLEEPPLVGRGDLVTIVARSGPLEVKTPGEARSSGAPGEVVRVKNLMSWRIVNALVRGPGLVEVDL